MSGYIIYYEKNPQMQDYMLIGQPKKSFEAAYEDKVTETVRNVVQRNTEQGSPRRIAFYSAGIFLVLLTILGANLLIQSTKKIDSLEKTIETLSNAATNVTEAPKEKKEKKTDKPKKTEAPTTKTPAVTAPPALTKPSLTKPAVTSTPALQTAPAVQTPEGEKSNEPESVKKDSKTPKPDEKAVQSVKRAASSYVVQSGDTLSQIVWRHYHTLSCMEMVKEANKIENSDNIKEGQKLYLPAYSK